MGYRHKIGIIKNSDRAALDLSKGYCSFSKYLVDEFELGKLNADLASQIEEGTTTIERIEGEYFIGTGTKKVMESCLNIILTLVKKECKRRYEAHILLRDMVEREAFNKKIILKLLDELTPTATDFALYDGAYNPYIFDIDDKRLTSSWCWRDILYDLLKLYKETDWDKHLLIVWAS